jgi:hypothetical protein
LDGDVGFAPRFEEPAAAEASLSAYLCGGYAVFEHRSIASQPVTLERRYRAVDGSTSGTIEGPPAAFVASTLLDEPWLVMNTRNGSTELVELTPDGPRAHRLEGVPHASFSPDSERVFARADTKTVKGSQWLLNSTDDFQPVWTVPDHGFVALTPDYAHAVIIQPDGAYSLRVEAGQTPQLLDGIPQDNVLPGPSGRDGVILQGSQGPGSTFYIVAWPSNTPHVLTVEFDEPGLSMFSEATAIH